MKNKLTSRLLFALFFLILGITVQAQEFNFAYYETETEEPYSDLALTKHPFGPDFALKLRLMKEYYTYEERSNISNTTSNVVAKPAIYYSVIKTNKYLLKSVKKEQIPIDDAKSQLEDILTKALNIRNQGTAKLETQLGKIKDPEAIINFYQKNISLNL